MHYVKGDVIKEDFLFCQPLTTSTKAIDIKKLVDNLFNRDNNLLWDMVCAICLDGAPSHVRAKIRFWCPSESRCTTHNCNALFST